MTATETSKLSYMITGGIISAIAIETFRHYFEAEKPNEKDQKVKEELMHYIEGYRERLKQYQEAQKEAINNSLEQLQLTVKYSYPENINNYYTNWQAHKDQKIINANFNLDLYLNSNKYKYFQIEYSEQKRLFACEVHHRQEDFKFLALVALGKKFGADLCCFEHLEQSNRISYGLMEEYAASHHINNNVFVNYIIDCFKELELKVKEQIGHYILKGEPAFRIIDIYKNDFDLSQSQLELAINAFELTDLPDKPEL